MAAKKKGFRLPISPKALLDAIGLAEETSTRELTVSLFVDTSIDSSLLAFAKEALNPRTGNLKIVVNAYHLETVPFAPDSCLAIILAAAAPTTGRLLIQALREKVPAVAVTLDPIQLQQTARENFNEIDALSIVTVGDLNVEPRLRFEKLLDNLGSWIVRQLSDELLSLARGLDFVRTPFIRDAIQATSVQNAAIAAVFFIPGADMPLLTLNQAKLFLQIAAVYDAELDKQRLKELAVLLANGFGLRAIARKLVGLVPVFGWAARGTVGYAGTFAVGQAAWQYFEHGGDIATIVKDLKPRRRSKA